MKKFKLLIFTILFTGFAWSQTKITGTVKDTDNAPLPGANILEKGTSNGTSSDFNGNFSLTVKEDAILIISFSGFETKEVPVNGKTIFNITLSEGLELDEVVITGNRTKPRTILDSPVPIDNINVKELQQSGKPTLDRMLTFKVPSFNSQNQAISDATAHYDPADLRGLGPSRTLVLVNGKRSEIYKTNFFFKGIELPPGKYSLELYYDNTKFYFSIIVSILTLLILITCIIKSFINEKNYK